MRAGKRKQFNELKPKIDARSDPDAIRERKVKRIIRFAEAAECDFVYPELKDRTPAEKAVRTSQDILDHIRLARAAGMIPKELKDEIRSLERHAFRKNMLARHGYIPD